MHRLDREASGLLVFAKTVEAKENLQNQFEDHTAGRRYLAVVEGRIAKDAFSVRSYLAENAAYRVYSTRKKEAGKFAITHVHVVKCASIGKMNAVFPPWPIREFRDRSDEYPNPA